MADKTPSTTPATGADDKIELQKRARRRLVGAVALALLAVIVLPMVMDQEPKPSHQDIQISIPSLDGNTAVSSRIASHDTAATADTASAPPPPAKTTASPPPALAATSLPGSSVKTDTHASQADGAQPATDKPQATTQQAEKAEKKKLEKQAAEKLAAEKLAAEKLAVEKTAHEHKAKEAARAAALLNGEQWVIQLGAYQSQANVNSLQAKVRELGYPVYTEKVHTPQGNRIRVRCGPFATHEAAEKAHQRLKKIAAGGPNGGTLTKLH